MRSLTPALASSRLPRKSARDTGAVISFANLVIATFTDAALTLGATIARAVQVTQLRTALNAARTQLGIPVVTFTDAILTPSTTRPKAEHLTEVRNGVE